MRSYEDEQEMTVVVEEKMPTRTKLLIGGGAAVVLWWLFFRGGGKGVGDGAPLYKDSSSLRFRLLPTERLYLVGGGAYDSAYTLEEAISRVRRGGRSDVELVIPGDVPQGFVEKTLASFTLAKIMVKRYG
jgi:hypothetical protein